MFPLEGMKNKNDKYLQQETIMFKETSKACQMISNEITVRWIKNIFTNITFQSCVCLKLHQSNIKRAFINCTQNKVVQNPKKLDFFLILNDLKYIYGKVILHNILKYVNIVPKSFFKSPNLMKYLIIYRMWVIQFHMNNSTHAIPQKHLDENFCSNKCKCEKNKLLKLFFWNVKKIEL